MKNKGIEKDTIYGILTIIAGAVMAIVAGSRFIVYFIAAFGDASKFETASIILLTGILFGCVWIYLGIKALLRITKFKKYNKIIGGMKRFRIPALATAVKKNESDVASEISRMICMGYFEGAFISLEDKELVLDSSAPALSVPENELGTMYKENRRIPIAPFLAGISAFLAFSYEISGGFITGGIIAAVALVVNFYFFPAPKYFTVIPRPIPKAKPVAKTGNEELDNLLHVSAEAEAEMQRISMVLRQSPIINTISEQLRVLREIIDHVTKNPDKVRQLRQFINYYLPTTVKLLESYEELWRIPDKGENIKESISKIEGMSEKILAVFKREYDQLFGDKAMDISAEVAVMQNIIDESKYNSDPFNQN